MPYRSSNRVDLEAIQRLLLALPYENLTERQIAEQLRNKLELICSLEEVLDTEKISSFLRR